MSPEERIKALAQGEGFELAGIASLAQVPGTLEHYGEWLEKGFAGEMHYLERQKATRMDPALLLPGARSIICLGILYNTEQPYSSERPGPHVSRYAWGEDYHEVVGAKLRRLEAAIRRELPGEYGLKGCCDTSAVSEKTWAAAAGLGWTGKNTNLIHPRLGSWLFLAEILCTLDLQPDAPGKDLCGNCRRCLDACPTDAFPEAYVLDSRRCISYLSIEFRGEIPEALEEGMGSNLYGCDICQEVCPWNHWRLSGQEAAFEPRQENLQPNLEEIQALSEESFKQRSQGSSMRRAKAAGLKRNAGIVARNMARMKGSKEPHAD